MKNAVVIFYDGKPMTVKESVAIVEAIKDLLVEGHSQPEIKYFTSDDLAKELVKTTTPPRKSTEEGDNAVRVVSAFLPNSREKSLIRMALIIQMNKAYNSDDKVSKAFVNAMSYLSQGTPVSKATADMYNFTSTVRDCVKEVYKSFLDYESHN